MLCWVTVAAGVVLDSEDAEAPLRDVLAAALDANRELARLAAELREENERLRAENAEQAAELGKMDVRSVVHRERDKEGGGSGSPMARTGPA